MVAMLYPLYYEELMRYVLGFIGSRAAAEDLVQETFLRAIRHAGDLEELDQKQCRAWLYKTARNLFYDLVRHEAVAPALEEAGVAVDDLTVVIVEQLLQKLSAEKRELVRMRYFDGYNSTEIGRKLMISPATVRTRLAAAIKELKRLYEE